MVLHLDATDESSLTISGDDVTEWRDISGEGNDWGDEGSAFPEYVEEEADSGLPALLFPSGSFTALGRAPILSGNTPAEIFIVLKALSANPSTTRGLWAMGTGGSSFHPGSDGKLLNYFGRSTGQNSYVQNPAGVVADWHVMNVIGAGAAGDGWEHLINGVSQKADAGEVVEWQENDWRLGRNGNGHRYEGYIGEVIIYSPVLSSSQRNAALQFLADKWGVTV